ncbi:30S ribosomal protein S1 [bacterium]|nr:30S ribosomal protein S1 [bacterium]
MANNKNFLKDLVHEDIDAEIAEAFGDHSVEDLTSLYSKPGQVYEVGHIVEGKITKITGDDVFIDIGYKCEGSINAKEWDADEPPQIGEKIEVLLEGVEEEGGVLTLSKRKAARIRGWERVINEHKEDDVVEGLVTRKIKGGLLVDIGVNVFLPASQVDIRRPNDIGEYIGQKIKCVILKIDEPRRNIVVSRRQLIEKEREEMKRKLLSDLEKGQRRRGIVKNIADFGAFVDLGGIDGLLHITDMSWGRIGHPSEMVRIDQEIEVVILNVDRDREKIALGLKQKEASPWENVEAKYPVGSKIKGEVVNVMSYGAFVKIEEGIEGLVHISEMSWTKRINHPSELVSVADEIEVVVLAINKDDQEISLGMKQTQANPWDEVARKYPPNTVVKGKVRNLTNYGAFIEIEEGIDGLLHVSDISWVRKISHPSEVLEKGQEVECQVLTVDQERKRIALGIKQLKSDPWETDIPEKYKTGQIVRGKVTKLTNFGVFVELEPGLEGLLHVSELADHKVAGPEEVVKVGDEIECKVIGLDIDERKIKLSRRQLSGDVEEMEDDGSDKNRAGRASKELKGGIGDSSGPLFKGGSNE